jgi:GAF domain-containing protein
MAASQDGTIAELQRTITELRQELSERDAALARRNTEYGERVEKESATIDVLEAMSASPGDAQPVLDLIVRRAQTLCGSANAYLYEYDGALVHYRASASDHPSPETHEAFRRMFPRPLDQDASAGVNLAIRNQQVVHVRNADREPGVTAAARNTGTRAAVAVPLIRDGRSAGAISVTNLKPGGFSDSQIALLKTFAKQAVIAITSAEAYRAIQERTATLAARNSAFAELAEYQSA